MKNHFLKFLSATFLTLLFFNCSKNNDSDLNNQDRSLFKMTTVAEKEYKTNKKVLRELNKIKNSNFITSNNRDYDETYDFFCRNR